MLKIIRNNKAQTTLGEYLLVISIVVVSISAMGVYFRRALQARVHDARKAVITEVMNRTEGNFVGDLRYEYEPYYTRSEAIIDANVNQTDMVLEGIYRKDINDGTTIQAVSETAPPREAD